MSFNYHMESVIACQFTSALRENPRLLIASVLSPNPLPWPTGLCRSYFIYFSSIISHHCTLSLLPSLCFFLCFIWLSCPLLCHQVQHNYPTRKVSLWILQVCNEPWWYQESGMQRWSLATSRLEFASWWWSR